MLMKLECKNLINNFASQREWYIDSKFKKKKNQELNKYYLINI